MMRLAISFFKLIDGDSPDISLWLDHSIIVAFVFCWLGMMVLPGLQIFLDFTYYLQEILRQILMILHAFQQWTTVVEGNQINWHVTGDQSCDSLEFGSAAETMSTESGLSKPLFVPTTVVLLALCPWLRNANCSSPATVSPGQIVRIPDSDSSTK
ncbi:hypothetical protein BU15DRAFT_66337 [Melanogaster broomeanus]|nr:hypothetical protein BU15DRAFT_66337 [Melanogaster broomeanus]